MRQYNQSVKGKLFRYFEGKLGIRKSTKGWYRCNCPYCGGYYTFGINLESYRAKCFICPSVPNPIELLMFLERFDTMAEALKYLSIQQEYEAYDRMVEPVKIERRSVELPESYRLITQGTNLVAKAARHYLMKRGFKIHELAMAGVGFCDQGEYSGYIIFPYYLQGNLIYFQGRLFMGSGTKMKNPSEEEFGIGKSQILYNEDALYLYNKVYIVESITNARTLGDAAISISGKKVSNYQMGSIIKSPCQKVVVILDSDAKPEAITLCMELIHHKETKLVTMPEGKDVNDLGKTTTLGIVKATDYLINYGQLLKLKNESGPINPHQRVRPNYNPTRGF